MSRPVGMTRGEMRRAALADVAFAAGFFFLGAMGATVIGGVL